MKKITTLFLGFLLLSGLAFGQGKSNRAKMDDPYNKPAVWEKIRKDPKNKALWEEYVGKKAADWNAEERNFITRRRDDLWADRDAYLKAEKIRQKIAERERAGSTDFVVKSQQQSNDNTETVASNRSSNSGSPSSAGKKRFGSPSSSPTSASVSEKTMLDEVGKKQMDNAVALIMVESQEMKDLKKNITANFLIIQDNYAEMFKNLGLKYIYYEKIYPNGGYSEEKWVQEMDRKVDEVKKKRVKELTDKYAFSSRNM